jgi:hypothetical protein
MKKITLFLLACCLFVGNFVAAQTKAALQPLALLATSVQLSQANKAGLDTVFSAYQVFHLPFAELKAQLRQAKANETVQATLQLPTLPLLTVQLQANDLRSPAFVGKVNGSSENLPIEMRECITFKGSIAQDKAAEVLLTITDSFISCSFTFKGIAYTIESCSNYTTDLANCLLYKATDRITKENAARCGNIEESMAKALQEKPSTETVQACKVVEVAVDADFYFSEQYGQNTFAVMLGSFQTVAGLYREALGINFLLTYANFFTVHADCPYTYGDVLDAQENDHSVANAYLSKAQTYWLTQTMHKDLVHIFSGRRFRKGILAGMALAVGTACLGGNGDIAFTSFKSEATDNEVMVAHEIGHLLGGQHQGCAEEEGENTLMCGGTLDIKRSFSRGSVLQISNFINNNLSCFNSINGLGTVIEGPDFICDNQPVSYSFDVHSFFFAPQLTITHSSNMVVVPALSTNPRKALYNVTKTGSGEGWFSLSFVFVGSNCPVQTVTKTIQLGKPTDFELNNDSYSLNCQDVSTVLYVEGANNATELRWEYFHPITRTWTFFEVTPYQYAYFPELFRIPAFVQWYRNSPREACINVAFRATAANFCGITTSIGENTGSYVNFCKGGGAIYCRRAQTTANENLELKLSPNPAENGMVEIALLGKGYEVVSTSELYEVLIYNTLGQVVKTFKTKELQTNVNIQDLQVGMYVVKVVYKDQILQSKLMVSK